FASGESLRGGNGRTGSAALAPGAFSPISKRTGYGSKALRSRKTATRRTHLSEISRPGRAGSRLGGCCRDRYHFHRGNQGRARATGRNPAAPNKALLARSSVGQALRLAFETPGPHQSASARRARASRRRVEDYPRVRSALETGIRGGSDE